LAGDGSVSPEEAGVDQRTDLPRDVIELLR